MPTRYEPITMKILDRIGPEDPRGCWNWINKGGRGYAHIKHDGKTYRVSRLVCDGSVGILPTEDACHTCDNPACVNPDHIFHGTTLDNLLDCITKGRRVRPVGEHNPNAKLTAADVSEIRRARLAGSRVLELASMYGVDKTTIYYICSGKTWNRD